MTPEALKVLIPGQTVYVESARTGNCLVTFSHYDKFNDIVWGTPEGFTKERNFLGREIARLVKPRLSKDQHFMSIARTVAERATCDRKHVGSLVTVDGIIVSTGYNGSPRGMDHCDVVGHEMEEGHCVRTVHAEMNAIVQAAFTGARTAGGTLYTTASPCYICFKLIVNAGIRRIVFGELYRDKRVYTLSKAAGIELTDMSKEA